MIKKLFILIKRFVLGVLFIYAFNVIVFPINAVIPMNIFTIMFVTIFGVPGVVGICLFSIFVL